MDIQKIEFHMGATINLGDYENARYDLTLTAEMSQEEINDGGILDLADTAQKELAYALWDTADAELAGHAWDEPGEEGNFTNRRRAINISAEYRWMVKLNSTAAEELLTELVGEYWEKQRAEEAAKLEDDDSEQDESLDAEGEPDDVGEGQPDGAYVIDLPHHHTDEIEGDIQ